MKRSKLLKILCGTVAVLLVLWLGYLYTSIPHRKAPYAKVFKAAKTILLQRGAERVELHKSGSQWTLSKAGQTLPADVEKTKILIDALQDLQLEEAISDRADRAPDFEITPESGTRVTVSAVHRESSFVLVDGVFGKQAADFSHIYFKVFDSPTVYLARGVILGELGGTDLNGWREHNLLTIAETEIQGITIETAGLKTDLERSSNSWTMNGEHVDPSPVFGLMGTLANLKADDFVDTASTPSFTQLNASTITIHTAARTVVLHLGVEDKRLQRYPAAIDPQTIVWLTAYKVQSLLLKPIAFAPRH